MGSSMKRSSSSKPGCKGDPRMNRAVQARLENPDMPLYHALRIGGFNFPANEDVSTLDNDKVTLGQRKNQLLRRLRQIARRQEREENEKAQQQAQGQALLPGNEPEQLYPQLPQHQLPMLKQQPEQFLPINFELISSTASSQQGSTHSAAGRCRSSNLDSGISVDAGGSQKQDWRNSMNVPQHSLQASLAQNQIQHVLNKQVEIQLQSYSYKAMGNRLVLPTEMRTFDHLASPVEDPLHPPEPQLPFEEQKPHETPFQRQGQKPFSGIGAFPMWPIPPSQHPAVPQEPAVVWNALAVPATAGQPVTALAPTATSTTSAEAKESAALSYFQRELQPLYTSSMLSSGYSPEETSENSPAFRRFAFLAWKQECERLQGILGDDPVGGSLATGAASAPNAALV